MEAQHLSKVQFKCLRKILLCSWRGEVAKGKSNLVFVTSCATSIGHACRPKLPSPHNMNNISLVSLFKQQRFEDCSRRYRRRRKAGRCLQGPRESGVVEYPSVGCLTRPEQHLLTLQIVLYQGWHSLLRLTPTHTGVIRSKLDEC